MALPVAPSLSPCPPLREKGRDATLSPFANHLYRALALLTQLPLQT